MTSLTADRLRVLISTYLEPQHVERIAGCHDRVEVLYEPDLLPVPRYACDHIGTHRRLDAVGRRRWEALLARADVAFDFDWQDPAALPARAPGLRWVQATSAGIGAFLRRTGLHDSSLTITTAAGIHAVPLAEFALAGALHLVKGFPRLRRQQAAHHWQRHTSTRLAGRTVTVVGLGGVGRRVLATFRAMDTTVIGVGRPGGHYRQPADVTVVDTTDLDRVLPDTDVLVLCCALTPATTGLIDAGRLALLPEHAVLVNVARGQVIDEAALIDALRAGRLAGACLDVLTDEPPAPDSPLWDRDDVVISPHSASTTAEENAALTDLFIDNLRRYLAGQPLRNPYRRELGY